MNYVLTSKYYDPHTYTWTKLEVSQQSLKHSKETLCFLCGWIALESISVSCVAKLLSVSCLDGKVHLTHMIIYCHLNKYHCLQIYQLPPPILFNYFFYYITLVAVMGKAVLILVQVPRALIISGKYFCSPLNDILNFLICGDDKDYVTQRSDKASSRFFFFHFDGIIGSIVSQKLNRLEHRKSWHL